MSDVLERQSEAFGEAVVDYGRQRIEIFAGLVAELDQAAGGSSAAEFGRIFSRAQAVLGLSDVALGQHLQVSRPTVGRWAAGQTAPHSIMARSVFAALGVLAKKELRSLQQLEKQIERHFEAHAA